MTEQVIEAENNLYKNKIQNGIEYINNENDINNLEEMINEKYVDPEIIKQKARNDADLILKEREKKEKDLNKNIKSKSPKYNGNKVVKKVNKH